MDYQYIDAMVGAYVECALWSSTYNPTPELGERDYDEPMDGAFDLSDIAPESLDSMLADCEAFAVDNASDLEGNWTAEQAGHDFWLTRNGHGAGFWDRGKGAVGDRLSDAAHAYGSSDLYVGDDGNVYCN